MSVLGLLDLYDNWNGLLTINTVIWGRENERGNWTQIVQRAKIQDFVAKFQDMGIMDRKVLSFGFYDDELCIRV